MKHNLLVLVIVCNITAGFAQKVPNWVIHGNADGIRPQYLDYQNGGLTEKIDCNLYQYRDLKFYFEPEQIATFSQGDVSEYLANNLDKISKTVVLPQIIVGFIVDTDGSIKYVGLVHGLNFPRVDKYIVEFVRAMPKWNPAKHKGKTVASLMFIEIKFPTYNEQASATCSPESGIQ